MQIVSRGILGLFWGCFFGGLPTNQNLAICSIGNCISAHILSIPHPYGICNAYLDVGFSIRRRFKTELFRRTFYRRIEKTNYNINIMTLIESILAITISLATIITSTALGVKWLTKHYFDEIKHEMKPNSGTSMKDQVTRLESRTEKVEEKVDKIYDLLVSEGIKTKTRRAKSTEL